MWGKVMIMVDRNGTRHHRHLAAVVEGAYLQSTGKHKKQSESTARRRYRGSDRRHGSQARGNLEYGLEPSLMTRCRPASERGGIGEATRCDLFTDKVRQVSTFLAPCILLAFSLCEGKQDAFFCSIQCTNNSALTCLVVGNACCSEREAQAGSYWTGWSESKWQDGRLG